ncbi:MAG: site-specific integrase [Metallibacterium sp.]
MIALPGNPVASVRRPAAVRARDRRLEAGEEARLLEALGDRAGTVKGAKRSGGYRVGTRNPWMRPLVLFAIETAMRQGELLALRWENIDLKAQTAHLEDTKNGESRTVPLSSRAVAVLEALPRSSGMDERVFPVTAQAVKLAWKRATKRAGLEDLHFHDLRHEATSRLAEKLPNLIELAAVTGHKDLRMLKRYYHPRAADLAKKLG